MILPLSPLTSPAADIAGDSRASNRLGGAGQAPSRGWTSLPERGQSGAAAAPASFNLIEAEWREGLFQPLSSPTRPVQVLPQNRSMEQVRAAAQTWELQGGRQRGEPQPSGPAAVYVRIAAEETPSLGLSVRA